MDEDKKPARNASRSDAGGEEIKSQEQRIPDEGQRAEFKREAAPVPEKKEFPGQERIISDELRREIELMELDEKTKDEAKKKAQKIEFLGEKEKIEHLLKTAQEKGLIFAVQVAKRMNDPYLLDIFHDILAREGYYQKFMK